MPILWAIAVFFVILGISAVLVRLSIKGNSKNNIFRDNVLTKGELSFFLGVFSIFREKKLNPERIYIERLPCRTFNVEYTGKRGCYLGKIRVLIIPETFVVRKDGVKEEVGSFNSLEEAEAFVNGREAYTISRIELHTDNYMQCFFGADSVEEMHNPTLEECIDASRKWADYVKCCKRR